MPAGTCLESYARAHTYDTCANPTQDHHDDPKSAQQTQTHIDIQTQTLIHILTHNGSPSLAEHRSSLPPKRVTNWLGESL